MGRRRNQNFGYGGKRMLTPLRAGQSLAEEKGKEGLVMEGRAVPVILNTDIGRLKITPIYPNYLRNIVQNRT